MRAAARIITAKTIASIELAILCEDTGAGAAGYTLGALRASTCVPNWIKDDQFYLISAYNGGGGSSTFRVQLYDESLADNNFLAVQPESSAETIYRIADADFITRSVGTTQWTWNNITFPTEWVIAANVTCRFWYYLDGSWNMGTPVATTEYDITEGDNGTLYGFSNDGAATFGSIDIATFNSININGLYFSATAFYCVLEGNLSQDVFTMLFTAGGPGTLYSADADSFTYNGTYNHTIWRWDGLTKPSGWNGIGHIYPRIFLY